jgi:Lamin Tail Domain
MLALFVLVLPAQALAAIKIHKIYFDSPGTDRGSNASLNAEYIVIRNTGSVSVGLGAWTIRDIAGHVHRFPVGFRVGAGVKVWVHTGSGPSGTRDRYWSMGWYVWNNDGDTARLRRSNGTLADTCGYSGVGSSVLC